MGVKGTFDFNDHVLLRLINLGESFMANLSNISTALDNLSATLEKELQEIADALLDSPTQAEVDAVAQRVIDLKDKIANIIP